MSMYKRPKQLHEVVPVTDIRGTTAQGSSFWQKAIPEFLKHLLFFDSNLRITWIYFIGTYSHTTTSLLLAKPLTKMNYKQMPWAIWEPGMVVYACKSSPWEDEAGGSRARGQQQLYSKTTSQSSVTKQGLEWGNWHTISVTKPSTYNVPRLRSVLRPEPSKIDIKETREMSSSNWWEQTPYSQTLGRALRESCRGWRARIRGTREARYTMRTQPTESID